MKNKLFILLFICLPILAFAVPPGGLFQLRVKTSGNKDFSLSEIQKNKAAILLFLSPECPLCQNYSKTINALQEKYKNSDIKFYAVFPGKYYSEREIAAFAKDYKLKLPLLFDTDLKLSKTLKATITPEAFVIDKTGAILYQGKIDDWIIALGKKRKSATAFYLDDALSAVKSNKPVKLKSVAAVGCIIQ